MNIKYIIITIISLISIGCVTSKPEPKPKDTKLKERDWVAVYEHEVRVAIANDDRAAWNFFMVELLKEKLRLKKLKLEDLADE
tara:strand:+ start:1026 stop:1274 length:249 start_codon:yes stop_codon:yes gene_type:complete